MGPADEGRPSLRLARPTYPRLLIRPHIMHAAPASSPPSFPHSGAAHRLLTEATTHRIPPTIAASGTKMAAERQPAVSGASSPTKTPAAGRSGGGRCGQLPSHGGSRRDPVAQASVGHAVLLLVEGLGVECAGRGGDAGENRQGDQSGYDGLHGFSPRNSATPLLPVIDAPMIA